MRRSKTGKANTHSKIVSVAAKRFRERGINGIGVADVMKEAGTSVGGFYKHFESRDDLVIEALAEAFQDLDKFEHEGQGFPAFLRAYLSEEHWANPGSGCPIASLAGDIRHSSPAIRAAFTERVKHALSHYSTSLKGGDESSRRSGAILLFSAALGGLTLARAVNDQALSQEILMKLKEQLILFSEKPIPNDQRSRGIATRRKVKRSAAITLS